MKKKLLLLTISLFCSFLYSQSTQWLGNVDSDWGKSGNWSNGVPTVNSTVTIAYIPYGNAQPVLNFNTTIKKLNLGSNNQTLSIASDIILDVTQDLSIGNSGTLDVGDGHVVVNNQSTLGGILNIGLGSIKFLGGVQVNGVVNMYGGEFVVGEENASFANFQLSGSATFNLNNSSLIIYGPATFTGGTNFYGGSGEVSIYGDTVFNGGSNFELEQGSINFYGTSTFSSTFDAGSGNLGFYDDVNFSWGSFDAGESTAVFDGNFTIGNNNGGPWGPNGIFNHVEITEGSSITGNLPLTVTGDFNNEGDYNHLPGTSIDIYGDVNGSGNTNSDYPFVVSLEAINTNTIEVALNESIMISSISSISGGTAIKNGHQNTSTQTNQITSVSLKSGTDNVLVLAFSPSVDFTLNSSYLWINGNLKDLDGNSLRSPYIKQVKKVNHIYWTGSSDTNWTNTSNWQDDTGILNGNFPDPNVGYDVIFDVNASHDLILPQDVVIGDYINLSSKSLDLDGYTAYIGGRILTNSLGKIVGDELGSTLVLESEFNQTIPQDLLYNNTLDNLTISNTGGQVLLEGELNLTGILTLQKGVFKTQDNLTLKSYLNKTAIVAPVVNGGIEGDVIVERYLPAKRAFRFISSSVTTTTSINENWQEGVNNIGITEADNLNPNPGFGTHITGSTNGANGLDATPSGNPSLFTFDVANQSWDAVTNTLTNNLEAGKPYRMMVRGDRSVDVTNNNTTPQPTVLRAKGTLTTGNYIYNDLEASPGGFALIGNPYQAPVDANQLLQNSGGINAQFFYVWDPTQNTRGAYVTVDANLNSNNMSSSSANKFLQPWQGAFVKLLGNQTPFLNFTENIKKVSTVTTTTFSESDNIDNVQTLHVELFEAEALQNGYSAADGFTVNFSSDFSNDINESDAGKLGNLDENLAIYNDNHFLSIENRGIVENQDEILFYNNNYRNTNYVYAITLPNLSGFAAYLEDSYLGTSTALQNNEVNYISFQVDENIEESLASDRFKITFAESDQLNTSDYTLENSIIVYPNPTNVGYISVNLKVDSFSKGTVKVYNLLGKMVNEKSIEANQEEVRLSTEQFSAGVYLVKVTLGYKSYAQKVIVE